MIKVISIVESNFPTDKNIYGVACHLSVRTLNR